MINVECIFGEYQTGVDVDHSFKWGTWVQLKHSYSDLFFCFLSSKLILKLDYRQSWVLRPMRHVDYTLCRYQNREVADHSLK